VRGTREGASREKIRRDAGVKKLNRPSIAGRGSELPSARSPKPPFLTVGGKGHTDAGKR